MSHLRDRRAFGNIGTRKFRGARFGDALSPRFEGLLDTYTGAAAAYSLRVLTRNWLAGDVVEVRRVNTPATASFTANQITNGELATWSLSGDAFVSKWYDQSGNGNDAVQATTTAQPKIVSAGSLVTGGLSFDGTDDYLEVNNSNFCNVPEISLFNVLTPFTDNSQEVAISCGSTVSSSTAYGGWKLNLNGYLDQALFEVQRLGNDTIKTVSGTVTSSESLVSHILNVPNGSAFINGAADGTSTSMLEPSNSNASRRKLRIGCEFTYQVASFYSKPIKEIILYTSDQSANRSGIDANINAAYSTF